VTLTVSSGPVNSQGEVRLDVLRQRLSTDTLFVSVHAANNEVGTVQPLAEVSRLTHEQGALLHADVAQACGKIPLSLPDLSIDIAPISAHKLHGPKGIGALFVRHGLNSGTLRAITHGGGQEQGFRPGTLNVAGIVGMGVAFALAERRLHQDMKYVAHLRDDFEQTIGATSECCFNGRDAQRLPGTTSITFPGVPADTLIANVPELCISMGSACSSGTPSPSHVLLAMGLSREDAECTIRISIGRANTQQDMRIAADLIARAVSSLRARTSRDLQCE
jgi:cysteine desulfurase